MTTVTFKELNFDLRRSSRRRTIGITVERNGKLVLSAPPEVPLETLEKVVEDKRFWIYSKLLEKQELNPPVPIKEYISGEGFYYLGRSYRLKMVNPLPKQAPLRLYRGRFLLHRGCQAKAPDLFGQWYRDRLLPYLKTKAKTFINRVGAKPNSIQVRELGNRWGSCNAKGDLYFHWRVAMLPPEAIEYLLVHEMVHLIEHHHTPEFWHCLDRILPDYLERKRWLAENGAIYNL